MEPITTAAIISGIVTYIGNQLSKDKSISDLFSQCTASTTGWIKKIFLKENGKPIDELEKLKANPDSDVKRAAIEFKIKSELEDNLDIKNYLSEIYKIVLKETDAKNSTNTFVIIDDSTNVNTGNVNTGGGNFIIGNGR